jgi:hypothetical protein
MTALLRRHRQAIRFPVLVALGLLIAHDATYALQYGLGAARDDAIAAIAHQYWAGFTALAVLAVAIALAVTVTGMVRLRRALQGLPAAGPSRVPQYAAEVRRLWPRLLTAVTLAFLALENVEHLASGLPAPGLWALAAPHYTFAIPVLVVATGLLAAAGAWLRWRQDVLVLRLVAARAAAAAFRRLSAHRPPARRWRLVAALIAHRWILLRLDAGRAPPLPATA